VLVYRNSVNPENHWIAFDLEGTTGNRSAIGAIVDLYWDSKTQSQLVDGGIGFCSQNQRRVQFGLGKKSTVDKAVIFWPDGKQQTILNPEADQLMKIKEAE
jgi:enediyne biosynthesis protein E4